MPFREKFLLGAGQARFQVYRFGYKLATRLLVRPLVRHRAVPLVAVTGTNGKSTVCKLLHGLYRAAGYRVAAATTDGVVVDGQWIRKGDHSGSNGIWRALRSGPLDLLIAETARGGILRFGIGFERCQAAVVTNVSNDHLGFDGVHRVEEMAAVKARVLQRLEPGGVAVLSLDDPLVRSMPRPAGTRVIHFTLSDAPAGDGDAVFLRDETIWSRIDGRELPVAQVGEAPLAWGGVQRHHLANLLAAVGLTAGLQDRFPVSAETLRSVLTTFGAEPRDNLFRSTLLRYRNNLVLLGFCQNEEGYRREAAFIQWVREQHAPVEVVGLLTETGWKREEDFRAISALVAPVCDRFRITPPPRKARWKWSDQDIVEWLSSAIPPEKIMPGALLSLDEVIHRREAEGGPGARLYVVFEAPLEPALDVERLLGEAEPVPRVRAP
jgi:cyanophycin synthetase